MARVSRRDFFKTGLAASVLAGSGGFTLKAAPKSATDWVTVGNSGVKATRLAFGTGTFSGHPFAGEFRGSKAAPRLH